MAPKKRNWGTLIAAFLILTLGALALITGRIGNWTFSQYAIHGIGAKFIGVVCLGFGAWTLIDWFNSQRNK